MSFHDLSRFEKSLHEASGLGRVGILFVVRANPGFTSEGIAAAIGSAQTYAVVRIKALERAGWAEHENEDAHTPYRWRLTRAGEALCRAADELAAVPVGSTQEEVSG